MRWRKVPFLGTRHRRGQVRRCLGFRHRGPERERRRRSQTGFGCCVGRALPARREFGRQRILRLRQGRLGLGRNGRRPRNRRERRAGRGRDQAIGCSPPSRQRRSVRRFAKSPRRRFRNGHRRRCRLPHRLRAGSLHRLGCRRFDRRWAVRFHRRRGCPHFGRRREGRLRPHLRCHCFGHRRGGHLRPRQYRRRFGPRRVRWTRPFPNLRWGVGLRWSLRCRAVAGCGRFPPLQCPCRPGLRRKAWSRPGSLMRRQSFRCPACRCRRLRRCRAPDRPRAVDWSSRRRRPHRRWNRPHRRSNRWRRHCSDCPMNRTRRRWSRIAAAAGKAA